MEAMRHGLWSIELNAIVGAAAEQVLAEKRPSNSLETPRMLRSVSAQSDRSWHR
jgi:hypothetical protein